ncbi:cytochrome C biogenesis protein [Pontibacillus halophilus JSM 076056 = DSM 19796]|uniref:Cytochrome C biogenesis protein n=1 Tax=Pontibacillus halophilus JSM 076056 = DSM 19796 TaxID=1385510 RepID=A0A0A5GM13_9BACI|nr:cytochrome c biogenesis protein ResB [Pontibacillus halophilus]KGX92205.1 cytochrome C biogenesis protein [Pontibacillus halophilus JSM 076056 = DSM 19796]
MREIKCDYCGHSNPEGTVLCESCGKPIEKNQHLNGNEDQALVNMRYDGSSRRSQTYNKTLVDKIWNFFSSVKVGVWLIVVTLVASAIGTIFPQEDLKQSQLPAEQFYEVEYGILGKLYYQLGFHNLYSSWWYMLLVSGIGISIVIASLDRFIPLYRSLKRQRPKRHHMFMQKQRVFGATEQVSEADKDQVVQKLKRMRYKITEEDGHILAEKNRFSRWGPYVNHIGLILFLLGALLRFIPFMYIDDFVWVREGETKVIPQTDDQYFIENKDFILEYYDENDERYKEAIERNGAPVPKNYQTNAVIYKRSDDSLPGTEADLTVVKEAEARVNEPITFDGYSLFQSSYQQNEFTELTFKLHEADDADETSLGEFTVNLSEPQETYTLPNGFKVEIDEYFPDYKMEEDGPTSLSKYPKNPAFAMRVYTKEKDEREEAEVSFVGIGVNISATPGEREYKLGLVDFGVRDVTGLTVTRDYTLPFLALGGLIFMVGVVQGMYWNHRRIWIQPREEGIWIAAHTNKNWFGVKREIEKALEGTSIQMPKDQQELQDDEV